MEYPYFKGLEADRYSFYRVPKALVKADLFQKMSGDAKLLYALQKNISTEYPVPVCIQQGPLQNFVMLIFQIVECSTIVCTFTRDVF